MILAEQLLFDYRYIRDIYEVLLDTEAFQIVTGTKAIAICGLLISWYIKFLRSAHTGKPLATTESSDDTKLTPWDFIKGGILIFAIASFDYILQGFDYFWSFLENEFVMLQDSTAMSWMEDNVDEQQPYENLDTFGAMKLMALEFLNTIGNPFWWLTKIVETVAWLIDLFIYGFFLSGRFFFMGILRILGPLFLAFLAIDIKGMEVNKWFWKWFRYYCYLYILIIPYIGINIFCSVIYNYSEAIFKGYTGDYLGMGPMSLVMIFIVSVKIYLYTKSTAVFKELIT